MRLSGFPTSCLGIATSDFGSPVMESSFRFPPLAPRSARAHKNARTAKLPRNIRLSPTSATSEARVDGPPQGPGVGLPHRVLAGPSWPPCTARAAWRPPVTPPLRPAPAFPHNSFRRRGQAACLRRTPPCVEADRIALLLQDTFLAPRTRRSARNVGFRAFLAARARSVDGGMRVCGPSDLHFLQIESVGLQEM